MKEGEERLKFNNNGASLSNFHKSPELDNPELYFLAQYLAALPRVHVKQYVIEQCRYIALPWHERNGVVELPTGEQVTGIARGKKPRGMLRAK